MKISMQKQKTVGGIQIERKIPFRFASLPPMVRLHYALKIYDFDLPCVRAGCKTGGRYRTFEKANILFTFQCLYGKIKR